MSFCSAGVSPTYKVNNFHLLRRTALQVNAEEAASLLPLPDALFITNSLSQLMGYVPAESPAVCEIFCRIYIDVMTVSVSLRGKTGQ